VAEAVEDLEAVGTDPTTLRSNEGVAGRSGSPLFFWELFTRMRVNTSSVLADQNQVFAARIS
jgi:hypothetical protein